MPLVEDCINEVDARDGAKNGMVVVRMMEGAKPQPPQRPKPAAFLARDRTEWVMQLLWLEMVRAGDPGWKRLP
jgi:hypothetical protein